MGSYSAPMVSFYCVFGSDGVAVDSDGVAFGSDGVALGSDELAFRL